jgi:hypothetical protein
MIAGRREQEEARQWEDNNRFSLLDDEVDGEDEEE